MILGDPISRNDDTCFSGPWPKPLLKNLIKRLMPNAPTYFIFNKNNEHIGTLTPGGKGCNFFADVEINLDDPQPIIEGHEFTAKLQM